MPISSVQTLIKKWKMRGSVETKTRSGRTTKISSTTASIPLTIRQTAQNDETRIQLLATTINTTFGEESTRPMMKGPPSLLWNTVVDRWCLGGCVSYKGTGNLVKIDSKMNAVSYQKILEEHLHSSARKLRIFFSFWNKGFAWINKSCLHAACFATSHQRGGVGSARGGLK